MEIKVPFYHIVNMFLAGLVLITGGILLFPDTASNMSSNVLFKAFSTSEVIPIICFAAISYGSRFNCQLNRLCLNRNDT